MNKINFVNKDWELIETAKVKSVPNVSDLIYISTKESYYQVDVVIHKITKRWFLPNKSAITLVISETNKLK